MHYFMVPAAKEILFSTGILFFNFKKKFEGDFKDQDN